MVFTARKPRKTAFNASDGERWFVYATCGVSVFGSGVGCLLCWGFQVLFFVCFGFFFLFLRTG